MCRKILALPKKDHVLPFWGGGAEFSQFSLWLPCHAPSPPTLPGPVWHSARSDSCSPAPMASLWHTGDNYSRCNPDLQDKAQHSQNKAATAVKLPGGQSQAGHPPCPWQDGDDGDATGRARRNHLTAHTKPTAPSLFPHLRVSPLPAVKWALFWRSRAASCTQSTVCRNSRVSRGTLQRGFFQALPTHLMLSACSTENQMSLTSLGLPESISILPQNSQGERIPSQQKESSLCWKKPISRYCKKWSKSCFYLLSVFISPGSTENTEVDCGIIGNPELEGSHTLPHLGGHQWHINPLDPAEEQ